MSDAKASLEVTTCADLLALDDAAWTAWRGFTGADNPFVTPDFLAYLERTGCVGSARGWTPCHQLLWRGGRLVGAMPLYEKADSYGEFIFDWAWADAAQRHHLAYYPKLVCSVPFTPAGGRRVLLAHGESLQVATAALAGALQSLQEARGTSGVHVLFCTEAEQAAWAAQGFAPRLSTQYHFARQEGWHTFADFLGAMRAPSRKQVRRERARAQSHGLTLQFRAVQALSADDLAALYGFYRATVWEKGAHAYLTPAFFANLGRLPAGACYVATAHRESEPVAGALFFCGGNALYGRYWGAAASLDALHFELCYYLPIEWGLAHGIERFEAGAQGEHKLKRGLLPAPCYSAHSLRHAGLARAVADFCREEAAAVQAWMAAQANHGPFPRAHQSASPRAPEFAPPRHGAS